MVRDAVPLALVVALPAALPFNVKLIVCPLSLTAGDPDVSVADKFTVCPKTAVIGVTDRFVVF